MICCRHSRRRKRGNDSGDLGESALGEDVEAEVAAPFGPFIVLLGEPGLILFVLSSRYEGFSMVLLEAMSCALPVVAFDCPTGPSELIQDRVTGRLAPAGETAELAAAISSLIEQPSHRTKFGQAAASHAQTYDRDLIATRWENLFYRLHRTHENRRRPPLDVPD